MSLRYFQVSSHKRPFGYYARDRVKRESCMFLCPGGVNITTEHLCRRHIEITPFREIARFINESDVTEM